MAPKLTPEERVTLLILHDKGQSNVEIAQTLGVTEAAVRYHLCRQGTPDGRQNKPHKADALAPTIAHWVQTPDPNLTGLTPTAPSTCSPCLIGSARSTPTTACISLCSASCGPTTPNRGYDPTAVSKRLLGRTSRLGRVHRPGHRRRATKAVCLCHGTVPLAKEVLVWSRRMDQLSWHHAHNEAFRRLGGLPAVLRIDNLKTGSPGPPFRGERSTRLTWPTPGLFVSTSMPVCHVAPSTRARWKTRCALSRAGCG